MRKLALMAIFALIPAGAFAARITLRDGTVVTGEFISGTQRNIVFQDQNGVRRRFDTSQIQSLDFDAVSAPVSAESHGARDRLTDDRLGRTLPAGTEISVRTNEPITADTATEGRTYSAAISQDVVDQSGNVVIPRGSDARLVVRRVDEGGKLSNGKLALDLDSVTANGQRYALSTTDLEKSNEKGIGANRRTAEMVGGGAALGTLIGAIAGGGKGAAIGAAVGAAGGAGAQVLTKGDRIRVPAETTLNFRLDQPLHLRALR